jgi:putative ABC transport system permease protein
MNILRFYRRARFFLFINITGLAIGFAVSIMLLLFVVNELSYDKHFANKERIIRLVSSWDKNGKMENMPINLRKAYTELPAKIPGIESAVQIYEGGLVEVVVDHQNRFQNQKMLFADPEFFEIFQMKFIEGVPASAFKDINSAVITRSMAKIIFGNTDDVTGRQISINDKEYTVSAVVEEFPLNTHFTFEILLKMPDWDYEGLEFHTFYLIQPEASLDNVRKAIESEYIAMLNSRFPPDWKTSGFTEKLTDIYLSPKAGNLGKSQKMDTILLLSAIALIILLLAILNFVNMFITHGETRMKEIGIRKTNGAGIADIIRQFFGEVSVIVLVAFVLGLWLATVLTPYFSKLIHADVALTQLLTPVFIGCMIVLYLLTVTLSAGYPSFYLSRFSPLDILFKRIKFSKRRLTASVVVFQSVVTLVLISCMITINKQTKYLENLPKGYNPENVIALRASKTLIRDYATIRQELLNVSGVQQISGAQHLIGYGCSGQSISRLEDIEKKYGINEYRIMPELCELMGFQLIEGDFLKEEDFRDTLSVIILNEAAVRMLGLEQPVAGQYVHYKRTAKIAGVIKDFCYAEPHEEIQPLVLSLSWGAMAQIFYMKFDENLNRQKAIESISDIFNKFDPNFVLNPVWSEDIYTTKFEDIKTQSKIIFYSALLSMFIAMLGLFAIHLYASIRRTKEIGIRKIHGAGTESIFLLLSSDTLKWIVLAAVIAIPVEYYVVSQWLGNYTVRISLNGSMFIVPILIQCAIALAISLGLTLKVLSQNPVNALKSE